MVFKIENANVLLWGKPVTWYALTPIIAFVVIAAVNAVMAGKKGGDSSFAFRVSGLVFAFVSVGNLFFNTLPDCLMPILYLLSSLGLVFAFWEAALVFKKNKRQMLSLGVASVALYSAFSKLGCFLTGCCYGLPYNGPFKVVYGQNTVNPYPGVGLFPIQLLVALSFLALASISYSCFLKEKSNLTMLSLLFFDWLIYYGGSCLYNQEANRMIIGGFNFAYPIALASLAGWVICWVINKKTTQN